MQSGISLIFRLGPVMVVPFFARHRNYTSQHYNTHAHSARATKHILQQNNTGYAMACSPSGIKPINHL